MNKKITLELPKDVMCCFVNYVYVVPEGMTMEALAMDAGSVTIKVWGNCEN